MAGRQAAPIREGEQMSVGTAALSKVRLGIGSGSARHASALAAAVRALRRWPRAYCGCARSGPPGCWSMVKNLLTLAAKQTKNKEGSEQTKKDSAHDDSAHDDAPHDDSAHDDYTFSAHICCVRLFRRCPCRVQRRMRRFVVNATTRLWMR